MRAAAIAAAIAATAAPAVASATPISGYQAEQENAMRANIGRCAAAIDQKHDVPQFGFSLAQRQIVPKPERMSQRRVLGVD